MHKIGSRVEHNADAGAIPIIALSLGSCCGFRDPNCINNRDDVLVIPVAGPPGIVKVCYSNPIDCL